MASMGSAATAVEVMSAARAAVVETLPQDPLQRSIEALKREQARLREQKKEVAKQVRNTRRRMQRLKGKAREMSDEDLVAVLMMRKDAAAKAKARAGRTPEEEDGRRDVDDSGSKKQKTNKGEPCAAGTSGASPAPPADDAPPGASDEESQAREEEPTP